MGLQLLYLIGMYAKSEVIICIYIYVYYIFFFKKYIYKKIDNYMIIHCVYIIPGDCTPQTQSLILAGTGCILYI